MTWPLGKQRHRPFSRRIRAEMFSQSDAQGLPCGGVLSRRYSPEHQKLWELVSHGMEKRAEVEPGGEGRATGKDA